MSKKRKDKENKKDEDSDDPFAWISCCLALILGILMIVFNFISGVNCRLRDLDVDSWRNPDEIGVIPMNMQLEGILFVTISSFYIFGQAMQKSFRPVGSILTGLCGKMTMFFLWALTCLPNIML